MFRRPLYYIRSKELKNEILNQSEKNRTAGEILFRYFMDVMRSLPIVYNIESTMRFIPV